MNYVALNEAIIPNEEAYASYGNEYEFKKRDYRVHINKYAHPRKSAGGCYIGKRKCTTQFSGFALIVTMCCVLYTIPMILTALFWISLRLFIMFGTYFS